MRTSGNSSSARRTSRSSLLDRLAASPSASCHGGAIASSTRRSSEPRSSRSPRRVGCDHRRTSPSNGCGVRNDGVRREGRHLEIVRLRPGPGSEGVVRHVEDRSYVARDACTGGSRTHARGEGAAPGVARSPVTSAAATTPRTGRTAPSSPIGTGLHRFRIGCSGRLLRSGGCPHGTDNARCDGARARLDACPASGAPSRDVAVWGAPIPDASVVPITVPATQLPPPRSQESRGSNVLGLACERFQARERRLRRRRPRHCPRLASAAGNATPRSGPKHREPRAAPELQASPARAQACRPQRIRRTASRTS